MLQIQRKNHVFFVVKTFFPIVGKASNIILIICNRMKWPQYIHLIVNNGLCYSYLSTLTGFLLTVFRLMAQTVNITTNVTIIPDNKNAPHPIPA